MKARAVPLPVALGLLLAGAPARGPVQAAAAQKPPPEVVDYPAPPPPAREPAATEDVIRRFADDPEHRYGHSLRERPSWWDVFWAWVRDNILRPLTSSKAAFFWKVIAPVLAVIGLGWALYRLVGGEGSGLFARRDRHRGDESGPLLDVEDIAGVDLDALLASARKAGRLREVIRYRYLIALQALAASGMVEWRKDKTNRHYASEVRRAAPAAATAFDDASRVFAWVWYGDHPLGPAAVAAAETSLDTLDGAIAALPATEPSASANRRRSVPASP